MRQVLQKTSTVSTLPLNRRSLESAFKTAAKGEEPHQPHNHGEILQVEAIVASDVMEKHIRPAIKAALGVPHYEAGPPKKLSRAFEKQPNDIGLNCDFGRNNFYLRDMDHAKTASDMFSRRGVLTLPSPQGKKPVEVIILEAENTFIKPDDRKPHIHEICTKIAVPLDLSSGEQTYHVWEMRFRLKGSKKAYEQSEEAYQEYRKYKQRSKLFAQAGLQTSDPESQVRFSKKAASLEARGAAARDRRIAINKADEDVNQATSLIDYQPSMAGKNWSFRTFEQNSDPVPQRVQAQQAALA